MANPIFTCTQEEETLTARTCWASCLAYRTQFADFSPRYTVLYIEGKVALIDIAENLPNEQQRQEAESTARIQLKAINKTGGANWQLLKRYIAKAFPAELQQTKWNAAGMAEYEAASNENWQSSKELLRLGNQFITDNLTALTASDNMPAAFQATFSGTKNAFGLKLTDFIAAEEANTTGAQTRIDALNAVHTSLIEMDLDGQEIFADNEAVKKQFVYEQVLSLFAGNGPQGYKGTITSSVSGLPISRATITIERTTHSTTSDADGNYKMQNVAHADNQTIKVECDGFITKTITGNSVAIGVMTTLDITLDPNP